jgi:hypothetical protein
VPSVPNAISSQEGSQLAMHDDGVAMHRGDGVAPIADLPACLVTGTSDPRRHFR